MGKYLRSPSPRDRVECVGIQQSTQIPPRTSTLNDEIIFKEEIQNNSRSYSADVDTTMTFLGAITPTSVLNEPNTP